MKRTPLDSAAAARRYAEKRKQKALEEGVFSSLSTSREKPFARRKKPMNRHASNAAKRKGDAAERQRVYGGVERILWLKARPCLVCGRTPSDCAHIKSGGMGRKADAEFIVALCRDHHTEQHQIGVRSFERRHGVDLDAAARETEAAWQDHLAA